MARILVVEDDFGVASAVEQALVSQNHIVEVVDNGEDGLERLKYYHYDLAILDWIMPGKTGFEVCQEYRKNGGQIPVLFLTGQGGVNQKVDALDAGADDYLCKPFAFRELISRVKALLRRSSNLERPVITAKYLELDLNTCKARINGNNVALAPSEFALLELFMRNPGRVFSAEELLDRVFKLDSEATDEAVRQRILRLRKKIDLEGQPSLIKTIKGLGYCLQTD
jgi:DNA-binding response OmpR family regulator